MTKNSLTQPLVLKQYHTAQLIHLNEKIIDVAVFMTPILKDTYLVLADHPQLWLSNVVFSFASAKQLFEQHQDYWLFKLNLPLRNKQAVVVVLKGEVALDTMGQNILVVTLPEVPQPFLPLVKKRDYDADACFSCSAQQYDRDLRKIYAELDIDCAECRVLEALK